MTPKQQEKQELWCKDEQVELVGAYGQVCEQGTFGPLRTFLGVN